MTSIAVSFLFIFVYTSFIFDHHDHTYMDAEDDLIPEPDAKVFVYISRYY